MTAPRRGSAAQAALKPEKIGVPARPFLWTLDQVATMINMPVKSLPALVYYEGRSTGPRSVHLMIARNISRPGDTAEWRVAEKEMLRWLRLKGFRVYESSIISY